MNLKLTIHIAISPNHFLWRLMIKLIDFLFICSIQYIIKHFSQLNPFPISFCITILGNGMCSLYRNLFMQVFTLKNPVELAMCVTFLPSQRSSQKILALYKCGQLRQTCRLDRESPSCGSDYPCISFRDGVSKKALCQTCHVHVYLSTSSTLLAQVCKGWWCSFGDADCCLSLNRLGLETIYLHVLIFLA